MAQKETETPQPKWYPERWHPDFDIEAFHAANRLAWDKPGQPVEVAAGEAQAEPPVPFDGILHEGGGATLGKDFLDAIDHRKPRPEIPIKERLSIEAKSYLEEIIWNFDRVKKDLVDSKGQKLEENPMVAGLPLDEYLTFIELELLNDEEFAYIRSVVDKFKDLLKTIQQELLAQHASKPSVLERLETLQGRERSSRFSPPKKEE